MTETVRKAVSAAEAIRLVQSHQRVFVHGASATPIRLVEELVRQAGRLRGVELIHLHTAGRAEYANSEFAESFSVANLFVGANLRGRVRPGRVDYLPCFLSEIPALFRSGKRPIDVALVQVSPPDQHGFCTLGTSVDVARTAVDCAKVVIAQINHQMPRVHGDGFVHLSKFSSWIEVDEPLPVDPAGEISDPEMAIGRLVAGLVEDGSTLQMGIGAIPNAASLALKSHKNLGIHTEMWSDGTLELLLSGAVDNSQKTIHPGKTVSGFVSGSRRLYEYIHDNPSTVLLDIEYVNSVHNIARNPKVVAINSAVEVDLTGQVCADSIGSRVISGVGGQMDFIRGASLSPGGKAIIALTSRTQKGQSRISSQLKAGAGVVTTRAHVHYVITEYGVADLYGKTLGERSKELIRVAHPEDRERLEREWHGLFSAF